MKKIIVILSILCIFQIELNAQAVVICNESFENSVSWTVAPSYSWMPNTQLSANGQKSYIGYIPAINNDSILLTTPFYNLSSYGYVFLKFNQICKVNKSDLCVIEYRESFMGSQWKPLPYSSYQGAGRYTNTCFNDSSYNNWQPNNLLAVPGNTWWQQEIFDISNQVSYIQVQFRFKIKKGSTSGSYFAYGWLIDDFQIIASTNPIIPPSVAFTSTYNDTVFNTGPFPITAFVKSRSNAPLYTPVLRYTALYNNVTTHDSIIMNNLSGDTLWGASIPQYYFGTKLTYNIIASDTAQNTAIAQSGFYIKRLPPFDSNSVAMVRVNTPDTIVLYNSSKSVSVTIKNKGLKNLLSASIYWSVNGTLKAPISWTGNLPDDFNAQVTLGNYTSGNYGYFDTIKVWIKSPNGVSDPVATDDTLNYFVYNCRMLFNGDYIIGNSVNADFATINDALTALKNADCILGDIQLKIESGMYTQNIDLTNYANYLGTHYLTITSLANNKDSVILTVTSGVLVKLDNTNNFRINNITLNVANSGTYAIQFTGAANNIEIRDCKIFANPTATTNAFAGIYNSDNHSWVVNSVHIINNLIDGGFSNIHLWAGNSTNYSINNIIDSNTCTNAHWVSINYSYANINSLCNNIIKSRTANTSTDFYGLHLKYATINKINGNKIHVRGLTTRLYTVYLFDINNKISTSAMISNNEIIAIANGSTSYVIFSSNAKCNFYNNSIFMKKNTAGGIAVYLNSSVPILKNNIVVCDTGISPITSAYSSITSDYNNFYSPTFNLSTWKSSTGQDAHSISISPPFVNTTNNLELSNYSLFTCPRLQDVLTDINASIRTSITTMGAYSVPFWEGYNLKAITLVSPISVNGSPCSSSIITPVKIAIRNSGTNLVDFSVNPMRIGVKVSGAVTLQTDTLIQSGYLAVGAVDTFTITSFLNTSINGNYHFISYLHCSVDTIYSDDTVHSIFVVSKIALPYDVNFSIFPPELLVNSISGTINWAINNGVGTIPVISPVYGTGRLEFKGSMGTGSLSQAIFAGIDLTSSSNPRLGFWYAHDNSFSRDLMLVKISLDGGQTTTTLASIRLFDGTVSAPGWKYYEINLSPYANESCVSIILEASSFGGGDQSLDRMRLFGYSDLKVSLLLPDYNNLSSCQFSNNKIRAIIENLTPQPIVFNNNTDLKVLIRGADSVNYTYTLNNHDTLLGNTSDTITINQNYNYIVGNTYKFTAYINAIDSNPINDTSRITYSVRPDISLDSVRGITASVCKKTGDSVFISVFLTNTGNISVSNIPLCVSINKTPCLFDTIQQILNPGDTTHFYFSRPYLVPLASYVQPFYSFSVKNNYLCDVKSTNDEITFLACVDLDSIIDLSILSIQKPIANSCDSGRTLLFPKVSLENKGNIDITNAYIHLMIDSADEVIHSLLDTIENLAAFATSDFEFSTPYFVPNMSSIQDTYKITAFIDFIPDDIDMHNDTASIQACAIFNTVSIENYKHDSWSAGQNIPNPATSSILIPYSIPEDGIIQFQLMSINGQILINKEISAISGNHYVDLNVLSLADGFYFYRFIYKSQEITKKMTVQK